MKLLLHACCGLCLLPTEQLTAAGTDFDILFFNPNIHPYKEFKHRLSTLREFCEKKRYNLIIDKSYPIEECIRGMLSEPTVRCAFCYRMRLRYAAQFAKENGYDAFSTTLLVSPYQRHELIKKEAEAAGVRVKGVRLLEDGTVFISVSGQKHAEGGGQASGASTLSREAGEGQDSGISVEPVRPVGSTKARQEQFVLADGEALKGTAREDLKERFAAVIGSVRPSWRW